jgi:serpin B
MKLFILIIFILLCPALFLQANSLAPPINDFGLHLLRSLNNDNNNLMISPFSVYSALALACEGADDENLIQLQKVLYITPDLCVPQKLREIRRKLVADSVAGSIELNIANALWLRDDYQIKESYSQTVTHKFQAEIKQADFSNLELILQEVNQWVAAHTNNKIPSILEDIDPLTALILLNAIYFKGDWHREFDAVRTRQEDFYLATATTTKIEMMHQTGKFPYYENDQMQAIKLKYNASDYSLIVILPRQINGAAAALDNLDSGFIKLINSPEPKITNIALSLPKFKIDYNTQLNDNLISMGMPLAFTNAADFSRINCQSDLFIGQVRHRSYIEVDEKGTEAAAATAVTMVLKSAGPPQTPVEFRADHPFIFLLLEDTLNLILFAGIVYYPE